MIPHTKICTRCGDEKAITDFHRRNHRVRLGVRAACKTCTSRESAERRKTHPCRQDPLKARVRARTRDAIRRGLLIPQPCRACHDPHVEPHHPDYAAPDAHLHVIFLCRQHHALEHGHHAWTKQLDLFPALRPPAPPVAAPQPTVCTSPAWAGQLELFADE